MRAAILGLFGPKACSLDQTADQDARQRRCELSHPLGGRVRRGEGNCHYPIRPPFLPPFLQQHQKVRAHEAVPLEQLRAP